MLYTLSTTAIRAIKQVIEDTYGAADQRCTLLDKRLSAYVTDEGIPGTRTIPLSINKFTVGFNVDTTAADVQLYVSFDPLLSGDARYYSDAVVQDWTAIGNPLPYTFFIDYLEPAGGVSDALYSMQYGEKADLGSAMKYPGLQYFSTDEDIVYICDENMNWIAANASGGGIFTPTLPDPNDPNSPPIQGIIYVNTTTNTLNIWDGTQYVAVGNVQFVTTLPAEADAIKNTLYLRMSDNTLWWCDTSQPIGSMWQKTGEDDIEFVTVLPSNPRPDVIYIRTSDYTIHMAIWTGTPPVQEWKELGNDIRWMNVLPSTLEVDKLYIQPDGKMWMADPVQPSPPAPPNPPIRLNPEEIEYYATLTGSTGVQNPKEKVLYIINESEMYIWHSNAPSGTFIRLNPINVQFVTTLPPASTAQTDMLYINKTDDTANIWDGSNFHQLGPQPSVEHSLWSCSTTLNTSISFSLEQTVALSALQQLYGPVANNHNPLEGDLVYDINGTVGWVRSRSGNNVGITTATNTGSGGSGGGNKQQLFITSETLVTFIDTNYYSTLDIRNMTWVAGNANGAPPQLGDFVYDANGTLGYIASVDTSTQTCKAYSITKVGSGTTSNTVLYYQNKAAFPATGTINILYYAQVEKQFYRWMPAQVGPPVVAAQYVEALDVTGSEIAVYTSTTQFPTTPIAGVKLYFAEQERNFYKFESGAYTPVVYPADPKDGERYYLSIDASSPASAGDTTPIWRSGQELRSYITQFLADADYNVLDKDTVANRTFYILSPGGTNVPYPPPPPPPPPPPNGDDTPTPDSDKIILSETYAAPSQFTADFVKQLAMWWLTMLKDDEAALAAAIKSKLDAAAVEEGARLAKASITLLHNPKNVTPRSTLIGLYNANNSVYTTSRGYGYFYTVATHYDITEPNPGQYNDPTFPANRLRGYNMRMSLSVRFRTPETYAVVGDACMGVPTLALSMGNTGPFFTNTADRDYTECADIVAAMPREFLANPTWNDGTFAGGMTLSSYDAGQSYFNQEIADPANTRSLRNFMTGYPAAMKMCTEKVAGQSAVICNKGVPGSVNTEGVYIIDDVLLDTSAVYKIFNALISLTTN